MDEYLRLMRQLPDYFTPEFRRGIKAYNNKGLAMDYLTEFIYHLDNIRIANKLGDEELLLSEGVLHIRLLPREVRNAVVYDANKTRTPLIPDSPEPKYPEWML